MIILDKPYVSDFLKETIRKLNIPVLRTKDIHNFHLCDEITLWDEQQAIHHYKNTPFAPLYTSSENSIEWIVKNLQFTDLPNQINALKNKVRFRRLLADMFPEFYFQEIEFAQLERIDISTIPKPFIIKPAVGFFSMDVYRVDNKNDWLFTVQAIKKNMIALENLYPTAVLDTSTFIIEEIISGTEFAFDAYFDDHGEPVVLNIFQHVFASENDVSDRVYVTSRSILLDHLKSLTSFLQSIGDILPLKNFPMHVEVRIGDDGIIRPIEINPLRFGGWCTTADMTYHAYNFNSYDYFFNNKKPNWPSILKNNNSLYGIIVLDNSTGVDSNSITNFDYDKLLRHFEKPLELRKIDYNEYPVFGFLFVETRTDQRAELEYILKSDLREFIEQ